MAVKVKQISLYIMAFFYIGGGINHFANPDFYLPLIPPYLVYIEPINILAGIAEIILGIGVIIPATRKWAVIGIILMLIAFIPSHVYFIQIGGCIQEGLCAPEWIGWVRLIVIHPLLIWWAWTNRN